MDDRSGAFLPGETARSGTVRRVRGGDGARFTGGPYPDASWEGNGWETELGNHAPGGEPRTYRLAFPTAGGPWNCPVDGCPVRAETWTTMQVHLFH